MIDLISTREEVDPDTKAYARVLVAVIVRAAQDLAAVPGKEEQKLQFNIDRNAVSSLKFFYEKGSAFRAYAGMIGFDPDQFLQALENGRPMDVAHPLFKEQDFRACRVRIRWWKELQAREKAAEATA